MDGPVRYKTYQSKRNSASSVASIQSTLGSQSPPRPPQATDRAHATSTHPSRLSYPQGSSLKRPVNPATNALDRFPSTPVAGRSSLLGPSALSSSSRSTSPTPSIASHQSVSIHAQTKAPYLSGFQPQGVYRPKTDEFLALRSLRTETKRLENARISRRLEKLVDLHFPDPSATSSLLPADNGSGSDLASAFKAGSASEVWSSFRRTVQGSTLRKMEDLRLAEQSIVKWQDDKASSNCAICSIPFSLTVRKHHCRLCGRVVCNIPPNSNPPPIGRKQRCDTFIRYEWPVEEEKNGFVFELEDVPTEEGQAAREKYGVRVCQECCSVILRQQAATHPAPPPTWIRLHEALIQLQNEIDAALPALQEQVLATSAQTSIANLSAKQRAALVNSRKKILGLFASFDSLSKRIRDLPVPAHPDAQPHAGGSAQERLQKAIAQRATLFLQERMGLLKGMGSFDDLPASTDAEIRAAAKKSDKRRSLQEQKELEAKAEQLAVLLEQEKLVKGYLEEAHAKRQLVDAASLRQGLAELHKEIDRLKAEV